MPDGPELGSAHTPQEADMAWHMLVEQVQPWTREAMMQVFQGFEDGRQEEQALVELMLGAAMEELSDKILLFCLDHHNAPPIHSALGRDGLAGMLCDVLSDALIRGFRENPDPGERFGLKEQMNFRLFDFLLKFQGLR